MLAKNTHKILAGALSMSLLLGLLPVSALAAEEPSGHLEGCGYVCTHVHGDCGYAEAVPAGGCAYVHTHDETCGYAEGAEEINCPNEDCTGEEEGHTAHVDAVLAAVCTDVHEHDAACGYTEGAEAQPCTHVCGADEWVCTEGCPVAAAETDTEVPTPMDISDIESNLLLDVAAGPITVASGADGFIVTQGETGHTLAADGTLTIYGDVVTEETSYVDIRDGVSGLVLVTGDLTMSSRYSRYHIISIGDAQVDWKLQGSVDLSASYASCIRLNEGAIVRVHGTGSLATSNTGSDCAAIRVPERAELIVDGAVVTATGGGAGIGSDFNSRTTPFPAVEGEKYELSAGTIKIINGATVTAKGGTGSAAIGGGLYANGGTTLIGAGCFVDATAGGDGAAAIGGGVQANYIYQQYNGEYRGGGKSGDITIEAGATVTAFSTSGAAIGRGICSNKQMIADTSGSITIEAGAAVTAISLGHDNYTGDHGKPYYFAIDTGIANYISAPVLNARFDKDALPRKRSTVIKDPVTHEPIGSIPAYNDLTVTGGSAAIPLSLPASNPSAAFAVTLPAPGDYMVCNAAEGLEDERAGYLMEVADSPFLFTVGDTMTTRDQLTFVRFTITASAGAHGTISDPGECAVSPLGDQRYTFTPDAGYEVDTVTVDGAPLPGEPDSYAFTDVTEDHTITVSFKAAAVTPPPVDPVYPPAVYYTVTVNYLDADTGVQLADSVSVRLLAGSRYDVSAQSAREFEGYALSSVAGETSGILRGSVTVDVYYAAEAVIVEPDTPTGGEPEITDQGATEPDEEIVIDDENTPTGSEPDADLPSGDIVIVDEDTPLGNLPQTGTTAQAVEPLWTLGLLALAASLAAAGLAVTIARKKEDAE